MQYVICYDVSEDARRDRIAALLKNYGRRVQYSVFLADVDEELAAEMRAKLGRLVRQPDKVHVFVLCGACEARTTTFGAAELPVDEEFYIV